MGVADGWPVVPLGERWLRGLVDLAEEEAGELLDPVVDDVHVVLAFSRAESGSAAVLDAVGLDARRLCDFVLYITGVNEARAAQRQGRPYRRTGKNRARREPPRRVTPEARRIVEEALAEATANAAPVVGADHMLAALCRHSGPPSYFGLTEAEARRRLGLRHRPPRYAHLPELVAAAGRRPRGHGPLVLGGGGEEVMDAVFARSDPIGRSGRRPRLVLIGAADPERRGTDLVRRECEAAAGELVDSGLYRRADAAEPAVGAAIAGADVVLLAGGRPEPLLESLVGTPALEALIDASDAGAVVMGSSAGAMALGEAALSDRVIDDGFTRLDALGWLRGVSVHTHWVDRTDDDQRVAELHRSVLPELDTLVIAQRGAVWVEPGWQRFRVLARGDHGLGAHRVHVSDGTIEPLPDL